jgi:hypothetical protein
LCDRKSILTLIESRRSPDIQFPIRFTFSDWEESVHKAPNPADNSKSTGGRTNVHGETVRSRYRCYHLVRSNLWINLLSTGIDHILGVIAVVFLIIEICKAGRILVQFGCGDESCVCGSLERTVIVQALADALKGQGGA